MEHELQVRHLTIEVDLSVTAAPEAVAEGFRRWIRDGGLPRHPMGVAVEEQAIDGRVLLVGDGYQLTWRSSASGGTLDYDRHTPTARPLDMAIADLLEGFLFVARRFGLDFDTRATVERLRLRIKDRAVLCACIPEESLDAIAIAWYAALPGKRATLVRLQAEANEGCGVRILLRSPLVLSTVATIGS